MLSDEEANRIGKAIRDAAEMVSLPVENPMERRAVSVHLAVNASQRSFREEVGIDELLDSAQKIYNFITGEEE